MVRTSSWHCTILSSALLSLLAFDIPLQVLFNLFAKQSHPDLFRNYMFQDAVHHITDPPLSNKGAFVEELINHVRDCRHGVFDL